MKIRSKVAEEIQQKSLHDLENKFEEMKTQNSKLQQEIHDRDVAKVNSVLFYHLFLRS